MSTLQESGARAARAFALLSVACVLALVPACAKREASPAGRGLVVKNPFGDRPTFFDFGNVPYGEKVEHTFQLENGDPAPLTILDMLPSCGCTVPRVAYRGADGVEVEGRVADPTGVITIPPGTVAMLTVTVDTTQVERANLDKLAQVRLRTDSPTTPYLTLELHLVVERAFRAVPERVELGLTPQSVGKSARVDISVARPGSAAKIVSVKSIEGPFEATVDRTEISDQEVWIGVVSVKPGLQIGPVFGSVTLATTAEDGTSEGPPFKFAVDAQVAQDVVLTPGVLQLGTYARNEARRVTAMLRALVPGESVGVRATSIDPTAGSAPRVECEPIHPSDDGRAQDWTVTFHAPEGAPSGTFAGRVTFELDHPRVPKIVAPYSGTAQ